MSTATTERRQGLTSDKGMKAPCRVATTANITLSGLQTVDGVALAADDYVLVKDQTDSTENGIWIANSSDWTRRSDADGLRDLSNGTLALVTSGSQANTLFRLSATDPVSPGTTAIEWETTVAQLTEIFEESFTSTAGQTLYTLSSNTYTPGSNTLLVIMNGKILKRATDYTETSGNSITLSRAAELDDEVTLRVAGDAASAASNPIEVQFACSDETTALTTGTAKITLRSPCAITVASIRASLSTAQTSGSIFTVDVNVSGSSILSTKLTIDNTEKTSTTAATSAVLSTTSIADDAEITVDIDQIGDGTAKGLKVSIIGVRA